MDGGAGRTCFLHGCGYLTFLFQLGFSSLCCCGVKVKAHMLLLCSGRDGKGGLCWEEWLQGGSGFLAYYGHLMLPWLPFPPHHTSGRAPKAMTRLELAVAFLSHRGLLMCSVQCQLLGTDTHHFPGGAASTQLSAQTRQAPEQLLPFAVAQLAAMAHPSCPQH